MMNNMGPFQLLACVIGVAILLVPFYQLWKRTGHSGWIGLLVAVPLVNVIMLYVLAFKSWPAMPERSV